MADLRKPPDEDVLPDRCAVWRQVRYDLFETKDVQDTPTFSYTWIADQGGHFSLGFLPSYLFSWIIATLGGWLSWDTQGWSVWIAVGVFLIWVVKELNDYRLAVRNARRSRSDFPFNRKELFLNIFTAWVFFAMGSAVAALSFINPLWALVSLAPFVVLTLVVGYWWLRRKITFQQANLPYLYRLATFPNNIPPSPKVGMGKEEAKTFIEQMITPDPAWSGHLILSGVPDAGKSTLAVAIGTEFVFRLGLCRYLSMVKLLQFADDPTPKAAPRAVRHTEEFHDGRVLWRWNKVDLLIIDDVDDVARVDHPMGPEATEAEKAAYRARVMQVLQTRFGSLVPDLRSRPRTIWVCNDPIPPAALRTILEQILGYQDVRIVNLEKTMKEVLAEKQIAY
jgi:hypothetical protein